ncbi:MAG: hypothetical protein NVV74_08895 [Magnetospirillum sp.]|nr:hypothetical protein [Magnetospirillum sp.]
MARNINQRLSQLDARRRGLDRISRIAATEQLEVLAKRSLQENYQKRSNAPYTTYALGSMQEVGPDYTRVSIEQAEKSRDQLEMALKPHDRPVAFRLQGSVPCNIHIRGVSDVDLLVLDDRFFTYDEEGERSKAGHFRSPVSYTPLSALRSLRTHVETILPEKFPAADVDTSGGKAVKISGGSLRRPVDVVVSHWHDTTEYQAWGRPHDRGVKVLDKNAGELLLNMPFLHIKRIGDHDGVALRGLKKAIRLCKHVKADAETEGKAINLPSFDIAAAMWHADMSALRVGAMDELAILAETQRHLDKLARNHDASSRLMVPDGSRRIFNTAEKWNSLIALSNEIDDLAMEVAKEQSQALRLYSPSWDDVTDTLKRARIPVYG